MEKRGFTVFQTNLLSQTNFRFKLLKNAFLSILYNLLQNLFCFVYALEKMIVFFEMFSRQDLFIIAFLSALDTYGAWLALSIFFLLGHVYLKLSKISHQIYYTNLRENYSFKSLLNFNNFYILFFVVYL